MNAVITRRQGDIGATDADRSVAVYGVIGCVDVHRALVQGDDHAGGDPLRIGVRRQRGVCASARLDRDGSAGDDGVGGSGNPVVTSGDLDCPIGDEHVAARSIVILIALQTIPARGHGDRAALDHECVLAAQAIVDGVDLDRSRQDHEVVGAGDAVIAVAVHRERAVARNREVCGGVDRGVRFRLIGIAGCV